jgi:hypothetical protein
MEKVGDEYRTLQVAFDCAPSDDEKDILAVIGLHEDSDGDCNNEPLDRETGLDPEIVDQVLDSLWKFDQIEGIFTPRRKASLPGRHSASASGAAAVVG